MPVGEWELLGRIALAGVAGLAIGFDRELKNKPAGLRTHALVAMGAAAFMAASILLIQSLPEDASGLRLDPTRIAAGVVAGVGFLGAGAIIRTRSGVHGLTTAAGIWVTAAIGVLAGGGYYIATIGLAVIAVFVHVAILRAARILDVRTPGQQTQSAGE